jgi:hypothetical protein
LQLSGFEVKMVSNKKQNEAVYLFPPGFIYTFAVTKNTCGLLVLELGSRKLFLAKEVVRFILRGKVGKIKPKKAVFFQGNRSRITSHFERTRCSEPLYERKDPKA